MYIIINNTTKHSDLISGYWPADLIESMLDKGEKFIVVSLYSSTIKVPTKGPAGWEWEEYKLPSDLLEDEHWDAQRQYERQIQEWDGDETHHINHGC